LLPEINMLNTYKGKLLPTRREVQLTQTPAEAPGAEAKKIESLYAEILCVSPTEIAETH